jgi:hypothetical protein
LRLTMLLLATIAAMLLPPGVALAVNISVIGKPVDVWSAVDTFQKCHILDVPDIPARAYMDYTTETGTIRMIQGSTNFHRMTGTSILNFTRECAVSWNMTGNPNPAMFAANEFLDSTFAFGNGTVIALIHTEYPGNRYGNCEGPSYPYCWTVSIGLAISYDWGNTWNHARPPPHHLVAAVPYVYNHSLTAYGWGDPSNIVKHPRDGFYYVAMWNRNQVGLQEPGICIARTNNLVDPTSWRGWNGLEFTVTFASPYDMDPAEQDQHICTIVNLPAPNCAALGLVWSVFLLKFVVTLGCFGEEAFYFATSDDLINWSDAQEFYSRNDLPREVQTMVRSMNYPTFLDPTAPFELADPNFHVVGQNPYLFWVSIGHSPYTDGRHLWATPMSFTADDGFDRVGELIRNESKDRGNAVASS